MKITPNALSRFPFEMGVFNGVGALTEMPLRDGATGIVRLPPVDGKVITSDTLKSLKAHEYGHIAIAERGLVPMSFIPEMRNIGASNLLTQVCLDVAVNAFINRDCYHLPFESSTMTQKKFMETFDKADLEGKASVFLQHLSVEHAIQLGTGKHFDRDEEERKKTRSFEKLLSKMNQSIMSTTPSGELINTIYEIRLRAAGLRHNTSRFEYARFLEECKKLVGLIRDLKRAQEFREEFNQEVGDEFEFEKADEMRWGMMDVKEPELSKYMPRTWKQKHCPKFLGALRYMHRSITDMKVWSLKDRGDMAMTVLIDCSGSMHLNSDTIENVLEQNPANIVAGYSGKMSNGSVYILGKNGAYADRSTIAKTRSDCGFGNIVDGPALVWLSKQRGRRLVWISDGRITGAEERQSRSMFEFCDFMIKKNGIEYYYDLNDFKNGFKRKFYVKNI